MVEKSMVIVYLKNNGHRDVAVIEPKRDKWRMRKMNIIASFKTYHDFKMSNICKDMRLTKNGYIN